MGVGSVKKEVMVPVEITWKGGKLVEAKMRDLEFLMDIPPFEGEKGKSLGPSATETFLAALGRCNVISVLRSAEDEAVTIEGLKAKVKGQVEMKAPSETGYEQPIWRFRDIQIDLEIESDADEGAIGKIIRESHKYCTVGNAVEEGISGRFNRIDIKRP